MPRARRRALIFAGAKHRAPARRRHARRRVRPASAACRRVRSPAARAVGTSRAVGPSSRSATSLRLRAAVQQGGGVYTGRVERRGRWTRTAGNRAATSAGQPNTTATYASDRSRTGLAPHAADGRLPLVVVLVADVAQVDPTRIGVIVRCRTYCREPTFRSIPASRCPDRLLIRVSASA